MLVIRNLNGSLTKNLFKFIFIANVILFRNKHIV